MEAAGDRPEPGHRFGRDGVERVLDILHAELTLTMRQFGTPAVAQITRASILRNGARL